MESAPAARERLLARQQELRTEMEQVQRQLDQLETTVAVSQWWKKPSGPMGRGTIYHTDLESRCRPGNRPESISLYEALQANLAPCPTCKPAEA